MQKWLALSDHSGKRYPDCYKDERERETFHLLVNVYCSSTCIASDLKPTKVTLSLHIMAY